MIVLWPVVPAPRFLFFADMFILCFGSLDSGYGVLGSRYFRVWGMGLGVEGLEFRV